MSSSAHYKPHDDQYPTCTTKGDDAMVLENNTCSLVEEIKFDQYPVNELQGDNNNNEDCDMDSPDGCYNGFDNNHIPMEESLVEGINNGEPSQVHFVNGALINGAPDSLSSCDCMSEASENQGKASKNVNQIQLVELQDCNHVKEDEDLYYTRTLCAILGNSSALGQNPYASNSNRKSSFVKWKKGGISERKRPRLHQTMLKKTLFDVPFMHRSCSSLKSQKENGRKEWRTSKLDNAGDFMGNALSDKYRETKNFQVVKSVVPSSLSEVFAKTNVFIGCVGHLARNCMQQCYCQQATSSKAF